MHLEKTLDSNYFCGKIHFEDDETQNYLVFQPLLRNFKKMLIAIIFRLGNHFLVKSLNLMVHNNGLAPC